MLTCYDFSFARVISDSESVDYLLVGDSLGMVLYGDEGTFHVKLEEMLRHIQAVKRGVESSSATQRPVILGDFVLGSYDSPEQALESARQMTAAGADILKLEGPVLEIVRALVSKGYRVCGHIGLTPQSIHEFKLQGKKPQDAERLIQEAVDLEAAGAEMIVLEMLPSGLAQRIQEVIKIPSIGIGSGPHCDGQVLVLYDLLGMNPDFRPKFLKTYDQAYERIQQAVKSYSTEVRESRYPDQGHFYN